MTKTHQKAIAFAFIGATAALFAFPYIKTLPVIRDLPEA